MTTSLLVTTALHFVLLYHYATTYWFYLTDTKERMYAARLYTFGGEYKYLTIWTMLLQLFYFFWCCVTDLISASASETSVGKVAVAVRDWFLAAVVFPIGTLVVTTFWAIYAVDRELIFPEALDKFFPSWLNHALHTYVLPLLLVDMLLVNHKYPSRRAGMAGTLAFGFSYLIWILFLGFAKDIWVYPFFKVLHGVYFPIFFATMSLILIMFYIIGEKTNALLGGYKKEVSTEKID
ncbi:Androgen-induced protein1 protein [Holothuria leucospilota]|uniref:Androgen-induced protein1 protein n=1 Tax=Holothuria leucospilota TaxID=206669 RepID=A0A9Q0YDS5_HOLLE|nr:Androgen-induced protein1 protein [Holothuria leucospilota]